MGLRSTISRGTHRTVGDGLCDGHPCGDLSLGGGKYYERIKDEFPEGDYTLLKGDPQRRRQ